MPHIKFQSSPLKSGTNSGSCSQLLSYLEKEDKSREEGDELKGFFNAKSDHLSAEKAKDIVEHDFYKKGLKTDADKFFSVTMSFSKDELKDKTDKELMEFAKEKFGEMYVGAVKGREIDPENIAWVAKLETERKYKGTDKEVKEGQAKSGEKKDGDQQHIHFVVARKTLDDKQISPMSNHFRAGAETGAVKSGFDQDHFKFDCEQKFDEKFNHQRESTDSVKEHLAPYRPDLVEKFRDKEYIRPQEKLEDITAAYTNFDTENHKEKVKDIQEKYKETEKKWDESKTNLEMFIKTYHQLKEHFQSKIVEPIKAVADRILGRSTTVSKTSESVDKSSILNRMDEKQQEREKEQEQEKNKDKGHDLGRSL
jgi:hypothetical protein